MGGLKRRPDRRDCGRRVGDGPWRWGRGRDGVATAARTWCFGDEVKVMVMVRVRVRVRVRVKGRIWVRLRT